MDPLQITIVGPGRAGMSLAIAADAAGHSIDAVVAHDRERARTPAGLVGARPLGADDALPGGDLLVIAVRDAAIAGVAEAVVGGPRYAGAVHLSGFSSVAALEALEAAGVATGSFHPLQTLPTPEAGAGRIAGSWIAVTADEPLRTTLHRLASSLEAQPFDLADDVRALYHAAAAAAANFPLAALTMAADLFDRAGVPFAAAAPLVRAVTANALELGPRAALTGPVARGDVATVLGQIEAVNAEAPEWVPGFLSFVRELARITGRADQFDGLAGG